jgi:hypothetical protein
MLLCFLQINRIVKRLREDFELWKFCFRGNAELISGVFRNEQFAN